MSNESNSEGAYAPPRERVAPHDSTDYLIQYFEYGHLPSHLQCVSAPFHSLAHQIVNTTPRNAERTAGLRKLLEAKDCIVRAMISREA